MPGDAFDESYAADFVAKAQQQDPSQRRSPAGSRAKLDVTANPNSHEANVVFRLE